MHTELPTDGHEPLIGAVEASPGLRELGWDDDWDVSLVATADPSLVPGRVSRIDRGAMTVLTESGPRRVRAMRGLTIAVGDWVAIGSESSGSGSSGSESSGSGSSGSGSESSARDLQTVAALLPRRSLFRRMTEGAGAIEQVVAANIDTVFIVNAVDGGLSAPHLQRYLTLVSGSGAGPVVVITKADLASAEVVHHWVEAIEAAAPGVPVVVVSTATGRGMEDLAGYLLPGRTVALLGLSGAGKSTMVNVLAGAAVLATGQVRADGQGRHVTTHRQLVLLPGGGLIIDTPGMRALSVWGAGEGIRLAFADLEGLAGQCEFADCSHRSEQGCAVQAAVLSGLVTAGRLESWLTLRAQPQAPDHPAARLQVLNRKRKKAAAKLARRGVRTETVKTQQAADVGIDGRTAGSSGAPL